jgi:hypothetical protein
VKEVYPKSSRKLKLPLPQASSTPPFATAIFYSDGYIYLGTEKWEGDEFSIIDVHAPSSPVYLGGFKTNTLINSIYVRDGFAYVAASDLGQMRILDVRNPAAITQVSQFSPSGWETQQGKTFSYFEKQLTLGRTVGGFNVLTNHELFSFSTTSNLLASRDVPGGAYGIVDRPPYFYVITHSPNHEFQIWDRNLTRLKFEKSLGLFTSRNRLRWQHTLLCDRRPVGNSGHETFMKGSTLIETLIYIALLSILMIGVFSSVYVLMRPQSTGSDTALLLKNYNE